MICPKCKKTYSDDNIYCVDCGTRLEFENYSNTNETPIERFSTRVKTSKPKAQSSQPPKRMREMSTTDNKFDILISQNKKMIDQNKRIIELLEKLVG